MPQHLAACRVEGVPKATARPRFARIKTRSGGEIVTARTEKTSWDSALYWNAIAKRPRKVPEGPLRLRVLFVMPRPKAHRKKDPPRWKNTKPDIDNLLKAVMDALTLAQWWPDDGAVAQLVAGKRWAEPGEAAGAEIRLDAAHPEL